MHTMHTFYFFFYNPLYSKGFRGVEGMRCLMHTARIPMHTLGFFSSIGKKTGLFSPVLEILVSDAGRNRAERIRARMNENTDDRPTRLLWVDTETTGLDPRTDPILEIGMIATGPDLEPVDDGFHTVVHWDGEPSGFIRAMHGPNGLLAECAHPSAPGMFAAALSARDYVETQLDAGVRLLPAGSTVRFDRDMIDSWMPGVLDGCSHRSLDVSALYEAVRMWNPTVLPDMAKTTDHRVMHCLADTLRFAREHRRLICSIR